ncbi:MAG TPA: hypothetical protein VHA10_21475 [Hypericibacter adhaerens]|jgi:hypothetical protein|uniref:Uncharacterized protein n=1 Tax=Hypericibacter adhaerens TaxID=2602016 RepID=A0A5J6N5C3_9PROT|nr:hypothetical protein [Hypericibacter adhaerens]QEX24594.1 hypothetical protein FRZ61_45350 [Hypericibacter adhaerens]HWA45805.1 hypothetical protein [Hypericibacter adhaerens]
MGAVVKHPTLAAGGARTIANLRAELVQECTRSIRALEEIVHRLKMIDSSYPAIGMAPAIAGYERAVGILASIDPLDMPETAMIEDLARLVQELTDTVSSAYTIARSASEVV